MGQGAYPRRVEWRWIPGGGQRCVQESVSTVIERVVGVVVQRRLRERERGREPHLERRLVRGDRSEVVVPQKALHVLALLDARAARRRAERNEMSVSALCLSAWAAATVCTVQATHNVSGLPWRPSRSSCVAP